MAQAWDLRLDRLPDASDACLRGSRKLERLSAATSEPGLSLRGPESVVATVALTTALLDRLAESATIITTRGKSFRTKKRLAQPAPSAQP